MGLQSICNTVQAQSCSSMHSQQKILIQQIIMFCLNTKVIKDFYLCYIFENGILKNKKILCSHLKLQWMLIRKISDVLNTVFMLNNLLVYANLTYYGRYRYFDIQCISRCFLTKTIHRCLLISLLNVLLN